MRSLQHRIALFLGLSSLLPLLFGVLLCMHIYEGAVRDQSAKELSAAARLLPGALTNAEKQVSSQALALASSPAVLDQFLHRDLWHLMASMAQYITLNHLEYAEITDAQGRVITHLSDTTAVGQISQNHLVQHTLNSGSASALLKTHGEIFVAASSMIRTGDQTIGTLTLGDALDDDLLHQIGAAPSGQLAVWKSCRLPSLTSSGKASLPPVISLLTDAEIRGLEAGEDAFKTLKIKKEQFQAALFALPQDSLCSDATFFALYRSIAYLDRAGWATRLNLLAAAGLLVICLLIMAWQTSKHITNPLLQLTVAARRMAALDFSVRIPPRGRDEVAELAKSFNHLSSELQKNIAQKDQYAAELAAVNANLEHLVSARTEELVHSNLRLQRSIAEKEDLLRAVSHDLSAPLRNIAGMAHLLGQKHAQQLGEDGQNKLERINSNVRHELQMIEQLLELSRIKGQGGKKTLVDLSDLLMQIKNDLSFSLEQKNIRIALIDLFPPIYADKYRLRQLFQNLIDNAIKYMGDQPQPRIEIGWSTEEKVHLFWVGDNGMGIPADQKDKIFGVFRRVKSLAAAKIAGMGVGLAVVKTIVELLGGEIWVESTPGAGSTFYFTMDRKITEPPSMEVVNLDAEPDELALMVECVSS